MAHTALGTAGLNRDATQIMADHGVSLEDHKPV